MSFNLTSDNCPVRDPRFPVTWPEHSRPLNATLFVLGLIYFCVGWGLFLYLGPRDDFVKKRSRIPQGFMFIGLIFELIISVLREAIGRDIFPCDVYLWLSCLVMPLCCAPTIVRLVMFSSKHRFAERQAKVTWDALKEIRNRDLLGGVSGSHRSRAPSGPGGAGGGGAASSRRQQFVERYGQQSQRLVRAFNPATYAVAAFTTTKELGKRRDSKMAITSESFIAAKTVSGEQFALVLSFLCFVPFLIIIGWRYGTTVIYGHGCVGCLLYITEQMIFVGAAVFIALGVIVFSIVLRKIPDPLLIRYEIQVSSVVTAVPTIVGLIVDSYNPGQLHSSGAVTWSWLPLFGLGAGYGVQVWFPVIVALKNIQRHQNSNQQKQQQHHQQQQQSSNNNQYEQSPQPLGNDGGNNNNTNDGGIETLESVLKNPTKARKFERHLIDEYGVESYRFIRKVEEYQAQFDHLTPDKRSEFASEIFETFIQVGSPLEVNISSHQRAIYIDLFCGDVDRPCTIHTFDVAYSEIMKLMARDSFPRFLRVLAKEKSGKRLSAIQSSMALTMHGEGNNGTVVESS
jgi:hypothetical protein